MGHIFSIEHLRFPSAMKKIYKYFLLTFTLWEWKKEESSKWPGSEFENCGKWLGNKRVTLCSGTMQQAMNDSRTNPVTDQPLRHGSQTHVYFFTTSDSQSSSRLSKLLRRRFIKCEFCSECELYCQNVQILINRMMMSRMRMHKNHQRQNNWLRINFKRDFYQLLRQMFYFCERLLISVWSSAVKMAHYKSFLKVRLLHIAISFFTKVNQTSMPVCVLQVFLLHSVQYVI